MTHEQITPQFNIEKFKSEFEAVYEAYLNSGNKVRYYRYNPEEENYNKIKASFEQDMLHSFERIVTYLAQSLKATTNKQEIIDITSENILEHWMERTDIYDGDPSGVDIRVRLWEKVIIELLKN